MSSAGVGEDDQGVRTRTLGGVSLFVPGGPRLPRLCRIPDLAGERPTSRGVARLDGPHPDRIRAPGERIVAGWGHQLTVAAEHGGPSGYSA